MPSQINFKKLFGILTKISLNPSVQTLCISIFSILLNFLLTVSLARSLNTEQFGLYAYAVSILTTLSVFSTLGFRELLVREIAVYLKQRSWGLVNGIIDFSGKVALISSSLISILSICVTIFYSSQLKQSPLVLISSLLLIPLISFNSLKMSILQGLRKVPLSLFPDKIIQPLAFLILSFFLFKTSIISSAFDIIILYGITSIISFIFSTINLHNNLSKFILSSRQEFQIKHWIRSAVPLTMLIGVNTLLSQIDILMLGAIKGSQEVAVYVVASKISFLIIFVMIANNMVLQPKIAEIFASGNVRKLKEIFTKNSLTVFLLSLPIALPIVCFSQFILSFFGKNFLVASNVLVVLSLGQVLNVLAGPVNITLNMTRNQDFALISCTMALAVNTSMNYFLIPVWGGLGAAWATTLTLFTWNLTSWLFINYKVLK